MNTNLFLLANQGDTYAQSFFTKIRFDCSDTSIDLWLDLPYLYSISEYVRTFLFRYNEKCLSLTSFESSLIKETIYGIHKLDIRYKNIPSIIIILKFLLIDPIIVIDATDIWECICDSCNKELVNIYNTDKLMSIPQQELGICSFNDDQIDAFHIYLKKNEKKYRRIPFHYIVYDIKHLLVNNQLKMAEIALNIDATYTNIGKEWIESVYEHINRYGNENNKSMYLKLLVKMFDYTRNNERFNEYLRTFPYIWRMSDNVVWLHTEFLKLRSP